MEKPLKLDRVGMRPGQESPTISDQDRALMRALHFNFGFRQKRIAALFDCNQGRVAEACKNWGVKQVTADEDDQR